MTQPRYLSEVYGFRVSLAVEGELEAALATFDGPTQSARLRQLIESPEVRKVIRLRAAAHALSDALAGQPPTPPDAPTGTASSSPPPLP